MTASLLSGLTDNAILYFVQPNGQVTFDPDTGNPIEGTNPVLEVRAMVKQRRLYVESEQRQPGLDGEQVSVFGRLVDPAIIGLSQIDRKQPIKAVVNGQNCRLLINTLIDSPAVVVLGLQDLVGEAFTGQLIYDI
jgi:hypothetical protein